MSMMPTIRWIILLLIICFGPSGVGYAQTTPATRWVASWGTTGYDSYTHVALDAAGNVYNAGATVLKSSQPNILDVAKNDAQGRQVWAQQWPCTTGTIKPQAVAVDNSGNVYVAGNFGENYQDYPRMPYAVTFGSYTLTGGTPTGLPHQVSELFLLKLDPAGHVLWAQQTQSQGYSQCIGMAVDADGNVYLAGSTVRTALFGALTPSGATNLGMGFVARYDAQGTAQWVQAVGELNGLTNIATDAAGACYIQGRTLASFNLGTTSVIVPPYQIGNYLAKLDAKGSMLWVRQLPSSPASSGIWFKHMAVSPSGDIRLTASLVTAPITFGSQTFVPVGREAVLCLGFSPQGLYQWGVQLGGPTTSTVGSDVPHAVAIGADGNSYFLMFLTGMATITQPGNVDEPQQFLVSFTPTGTVRWSRSFTGNGDLWSRYIHALAVASTDQLQLSGLVGPQSSFDGFELLYYGFHDAFTARLGESTPTTPPSTPGTPTAPTTSDILIPNIITPNGDGLNDTFTPRNLPGNGWQLSVYSRWGRQVYLTDYYRQDWAASGLPAGLYYYRLQATGRAPYQGWIEVVR